MKKSLINAIKKLLTKLGAEEIEGNNLVEVIDNGADAIEGGGGSGSGVNVLMLYFGAESADGKRYAFKDSGLTEKYTNYQEACYALRAADIIKLQQPNLTNAQESLWAYRTLCQYSDNNNYSVRVLVTKNDTEYMEPLNIYLIYKAGK